MIQIPKVEVKKTTKKKAKLTAYGSILLAILFLLIIVAPDISAEQLRDNPYSNGNAVLSEKLTGENCVNMSQAFSFRYLSIFGQLIDVLANIENEQKNTNYLKFDPHYDTTITKRSWYLINSTDGPTTVAVNDTLNWSTGKGGSSYTYNGEFFNKGTKFEISEAETRTIQGNVISTRTEQDIRGAFNYSMSSVEIKMTGDSVNKQNSVSIHFANSSRNFDIAIQGTSIWNANETSILDGNFTVNQTWKQPIGQYSIHLSPTENGTGVKALAVYPNGTVIDPTMMQFDDEMKYAYSEGYYSYYYHLYGWYVSWSELEIMTAQLICELLGAILDVFLAPVGIIFTIIEAVLELTLDKYLASDNNIWNYHIAVYIEQWVYYYGYWYFMGQAPYYGEEGYRTDTYYGYYMDYWVFYPAWFFLGTGYPHTSAWIGDPQNAPARIVSILSTTEYGYSGDVVDAEEIRYSSDDQYAVISGWHSDGDGGNIISSISPQYITGTIEVRCWVSSPTRLCIYSAQYANGPWTCRRDVMLQPTGSWTWVKSSYGSANYVAIAAIKDGPNGAYIALDSARIMEWPPSPGSV
ncbi:hypothetical protein JXA31_04000 [Candidatus Bathyarchaeota archaeon]|nr:hypothetical protein [Candidatus Bathyarchaeota archaeon]